MFLKRALASTNGTNKLILLEKEVVPPRPKPQRRKNGRKAPEEDDKAPEKKRSRAPNDPSRSIIGVLLKKFNTGDDRPLRIKGKDDAPILETVSSHTSRYHIIRNQDSICIASSAHCCWCF